MFTNISTILMPLPGEINTYVKGNAYICIYPLFSYGCLFLKGRTLTIFVPQFYNQLIISHSYTLHR